MWDLSVALDFLRILAFDIGPTKEFADAFEDAFFLGPYGLHPVFEFLRDLHIYVCNARYPVNQEDRAWSCLELGDQMSGFLLRLVEHFRGSRPRWFYDPAGFCDLGSALSFGISHFPVSRLSALHSLNIDSTHCAVRNSEILSHDAGPQHCIGCGGPRSIESRF